jgi:hypothetical protein
MSITKSKIIFLVSIFAPLLAWAAGLEPVQLPQLLKWDSIPGLIQGIIDVFIAITIPVAVFFVVYAGFQYITAYGDVGKIKKANEILLWTAIGIAVIFGAKAIMLAIQGILKGLK